MPIEWDPPLRRRSGAPDRLLGIELFHDFEWHEVFQNRRAQFPRGKDLARLIQRECPSGKTPAMLLTRKVDAVEGAVEGEAGRYVTVVRIHDYLAHIQHPNAAAAYFASRLSVPLTGVGNRLQALTISQGVAPSEVADFVAQHLDTDSIQKWLTADGANLQRLRDALGPANPLVGIDAARVANIIDVMGRLDVEVINALLRVLPGSLDQDGKVRFLRAITSDSAGRHLAGEVLAEQVNDRLRDMQQAAQEYNALLSDPDSNETDLQTYLTEHPWLLGLEYVKATPKQGMPRGQLDFLLERYDGTHDVLELKSPHDEIIEAPEVEEGNPIPSPSQYSLSRTLAQALAQAHVYRHILASSDKAMEFWGVKKIRSPRVVIMLGQRKDLPPHRAFVLDELNQSLHGIEILPYDQLAAQATAIFAHMTKLRVLAVLEQPRP